MTTIAILNGEEGLTTKDVLEGEEGMTYNRRH
jgi:hypothetical protein